MRPVCSGSSFPTRTGMNPMSVGVLFVLLLSLPGSAQQSSPGPGQDLPVADGDDLAYIKGYIHQHESGWDTQGADSLMTQLKAVLNNFGISSLCFGTLIAACFDLKAQQAPLLNTDTIENVNAQLREYNQHHPQR